MPLSNLFKKCAMSLSSRAETDQSNSSGHYHLLSGLLLAYDIYRPGFSAPAVAGTWRDNTTLLGVAWAVWAVRGISIGSHPPPSNCSPVRPIVELEHAPHPPRAAPRGHHDARSPHGLRLLRAVPSLLPELLLRDTRLGRRHRYDWQHCRCVSFPALPHEHHVLTPRKSGPVLRGELGADGAVGEEEAHGVQARILGQVPAEPQGDYPRGLLGVVDA
jgi:hypothetical protein